MARPAAYMVMPACKYSTTPALINASTSSTGSQWVVSFRSTTFPSLDIMSPWSASTLTCSRGEFTDRKLVNIQAISSLDRPPHESD